MKIREFVAGYAKLRLHWAVTDAALQVKSARSATNVNIGANEASNSFCGTTAKLDAQGPW
jgi:hypothetical protein